MFLQVFSLTVSWPSQTSPWSASRVPVRINCISSPFPWLLTTALLKCFWSVTDQEGIYFSGKPFSISVLAASGEWLFIYFCVLGYLRVFFVCLLVCLAGLCMLCCCCGNPCDSCLAQFDKFVVAHMCWTAHFGYCVACGLVPWQPMVPVLGC